jgi:hypothetical protein
VAEQQDDVPARFMTEREEHFLDLVERGHTAILSVYGND